MAMVGPDESVSTSNKNFHCPDCEKGFTTKSRLTSHKKFYCPKTKGIDHLVSSKRQEKAMERPTEEEIYQKESSSMTYKEDQVMQFFLSSIPSAYARFRLCENPRNPHAVPGF